jgi:hypothetical protein
MKIHEFTYEQIRNWRAYERVRVRDQYNMFDPRARRATGLSPEAYSFTLQHYSELRDAHVAQQAGNGE